MPSGGPHRKFSIPARFAIPKAAPSTKDSASLCTKGYLESAKRTKDRILDKDKSEKSFNQFFTEAQKYTRNTPEAVVGLTLQQLIDRFLEDPKRKHLTPKTLNSYRDKFSFLTLCLGGNTRIQEIGREVRPETHKHHSADSGTTVPPHLDPCPWHTKLLHITVHLSKIMP